MERNDEKIIQGKIRLAEQSIPSWNKEWAWSRIEIPPPNNYRVAGYTVAACCIAAIISLTSYHNFLTNENELMMRMDRLESLMNLLPIAKLQETEVPCEYIDFEVNHPTTQMKTKSVPFQKNIPLAIMEDYQTANDGVPLPLEIKPLDYNLQIENNQSNEVAKKNIIKPIIGKIPQSADGSVAKTESKEFKLEIFQPRGHQKGLITNAEEFKILTARINHN